MKQLKRNQQLLRVGPLLAACILITFANTRRWARRQIAFLGGANRRAIMRRLITQRSSSSSRLHCPPRRPCTSGTAVVDGGQVPLESSLFAGEETSARVQIALRANDLALPARSRRTRGAPFPRGDILRIFCTYIRARRGTAWASCPRSPMFSALFSRVLRRSPALFSSLSADRSLKS